MFVPYHNQTQTTFAKTITFSSGELSKIHGCQAMSILMVLCAAACFISLMYGQFANNMTHMFVRLRTVFAGLTGACGVVYARARARVCVAACVAVFDAGAVCLFSTPPHHYCSIL